MRVRELAEWLGATFEGDADLELTGVAPLETAGPSELSFVSSRKAAREASASGAGCLLAPPDFAASGSRTLIRAAATRNAFARAITRFHPPPAPEPGVHRSAAIAAGAHIGEGVQIGSHVSVAEDARIGDGCSIGSGCAIGRGVTIGERSTLHARVTVYDGARIGRGCILHSGCVIGADGFGFVMEDGRWEKFPQVGCVELGEYVEVGANACIDRAALGVTSIGEGTKLDNMVHVGHNCRIGKHVVVAAQTGFSGGVIVEDGAVIGGQVGIGDKARIESGAVLGSGCGILTSKIVRRGQVVWGTPARPLKQYLTQLANLARLPELRQEIKELRRLVAETRKAG